jgi:hypothetical protein
VVPQSITSEELDCTIDKLDRMGVEGPIIWDSGYCEDCHILVVPEWGECAECGRECELASRLEVEEALGDYADNICRECLDDEWFDKAYERHLADMEALF